MNRGSALHLRKSIQRHPDDFTHFNLTTLAKPNQEADYIKDGVEFKICEHLPRTTYFARLLSLTVGVERLTSEEYEPEYA